MEGTGEGSATSSAASAHRSETLIFPLFPTPDVSSQQRSDGSMWLQNRSFTTDLSVIEEAVNCQRAHDVLSKEFDDEEENKPHEVADQRSGRMSNVAYPLVESSASDQELDARAVKRHRKERKKKRRRANEFIEGYSGDFTKFPAASRMPNVRYWESSKTTHTQSSYFDSNGDRDNLEFGCLYRMDVARYRHHYSNKFPGLDYEGHYMQAGWNSVFNRDGDNDELDNKIKFGGRYWSANYTAIEQHKGLKRIHPDASKRCSVTSPEGAFVPFLSDRSSDNDGQPLCFMIEESWEDEVLRKTREFNKMTRENPHNEKNWLSFAEFQDKIASTQSHKASRIQTLEKKLSILEKAVELNPDSEELLLALLKSCNNKDSGDIVISRWEKILNRNSWSCMLWNEFLHVLQAQFSRFKVSEMRKIYALAVQAIFTASKKQPRQVHHASEVKPSDSKFIQLELGLVDIFVSLCRLEWQAGYRELATALFQAEIEYCLLCPSLILSEQNKKRLFEHFWNEGGARVGEEGALGWSTWLEKEEVNRKKTYEVNPHETDGGGWTGWRKLLNENSRSDDDAVTIVKSDVEELEEDSEHGGDNEDFDADTLMHMAGIDFDPEAASEVQDASIWMKWSEEESSRDRDQWMPLHASCGHDGQADEHLARMILFEDVAEYLFSLDSKEARFSLVSQFVDFFGGRASSWFCTNSSRWNGKWFGLDEIPETILEDLRTANQVSNSSSNCSLSEFPFHIVDESCGRTDMMKFIRNAILLCLTSFPRNYILQETALVCEELSLEKMDSSRPSFPSQALAKSLLRNDRQDVILCGVYARREAAFGNLIQARKIFDMALSSLQSLPLELRSSASLLYFWYAEVELANNVGCNSDATLRAMHILCCLGSDTLYVPYKLQPSNLQILKAHQGFKERIRMCCSDWKHGVIENHSITLICSAALFEELTSGFVASFTILKQAILQVLPESRKQSYQLEHLFNYYARTLHRHHKIVKQADLRESIFSGLDMYPCSPKLYSILVQISKLYSVPSKLRSILDAHCRKNPSVVAWLFALTFELGRANSEFRIRSLFERALNDEKLRHSVLLWRFFICFEIDIACNPSSARKIFFRAVHACPWSKKLWLDGFHKLGSILTGKELSDLQEVMRDKELNLRTDIYEILLQHDEVKPRTL